MLIKKKKFGTDYKFTHHIILLRKQRSVNSSNIAQILQLKVIAALDTNSSFGTTKLEMKKLSLHFNEEHVPVLNFPAEPLEENISLSPSPEILFG